MLLSKNADISKELLTKMSKHLSALYEWYKGFKAGKEVFDSFNEESVEESIRRFSDRVSEYYEPYECDFVYPCDVIAYYLDLILGSPSKYEREFTEVMIKVYGHLNYY